MADPYLHLVEATDFVSTPYHSDFTGVTSFQYDLRISLADITPPTNEYYYLVGAKAVDDEPFLRLTPSRIEFWNNDDPKAWVALPASLQADSVVWLRVLIDQVNDHGVLSLSVDQVNDSDQADFTEIVREEDEAQGPIHPTNVDEIQVGSQQDGVQVFSADVERRIYQFRLSVDGTPVAHFKAAGFTFGDSDGATYTDEYGKVWTLNGSGSVIVATRGRLEGVISAARQSAGQLVSRSTGSLTAGGRQEGDVE